MALLGRLSDRPNNLYNVTLSVVSLKFDARYIHEHNTHQKELNKTFHYEAYCHSCLHFTFLYIRQQNKTAKQGIAMQNQPQAWSVRSNGSQTNPEDKIALFAVPLPRFYIRSLLKHYLNVLESLSKQLETLGI